MQHPITESDLQTWVAAGVEEGLTVEYKRAAALTNENAVEITKDVSAMANSAGGLLFYGIAENQSLTGSAAPSLTIDPVTNPKITREWLEQTLNSRIRPRILDLQITPIRVNAPTNGTVFVVKIPEGATAHQADDQKYYRRFNFQNTAMFDHEIRDVMGRAKHPVIKLTTSISVGHRSGAIPPDRRLYRWLRLGLHNEGSKMARYITAFVWFPADLVAFPDDNPSISWKTIDGEKFAAVTISGSVVEGGGPFPIPKDVSEPLLPGLARHHMTICLEGPNRAFSNKEILVASVFADEAPPREESIAFTEIGGIEDA